MKSLDPKTDAASMFQHVRSNMLRGFLYAGFVSFFINLSMLIGPLFMMQVYERVIPARSYETLYGLIIIGVFGVILFGILDFIRSWTYAVMADVFARRLNLPALQAGVLRSIQGGAAEGGAVIKDIAELRAFIQGGSISAPIDAFWSIVFLITLYFLHPVYVAVAIIYILVMLFLNLITDRVTRQAIQDANKAQQRHLQDVANSLRHAEVIEAMGMLPALVRNWRRSQEEMLDMGHVSSVRNRIVVAITKSLQKSLTMIVVATGAFLTLVNAVGHSVLFPAMIMTSQAVGPFASMIESWRSWVNAVDSWGRIRALIEGYENERQTMPAPAGDGDLDIDNLVYLPDGRETPVLRGISFSVSPGEVLGIVGPSGAGKSTLARCLTGIVKPTVGGVYLDGHSTYLWERGSFGRAIGYLPQNLSLLDGTVRETIARMRDSDPRDVIRAAQLAGIHELIGRLPFGYDTPVAETGHLMSGGQMQRLALARALFGDPKLIILDEPNSNLDAVGEQALVRAIEICKQRGAIVVIIAHRPSVMAVTDKMVVIENGMVTQFGPRTEVIAMITPDARSRAESRRRGISNSNTPGEA